MTKKNQYGDWSKLTEHLQKDGRPEIRLNDDEMQSITGSIDMAKPYNIDFTDPNYSIRRRAQDAGYTVDYAPGGKSIKIFKKQSIKGHKGT